MLVMNNQLYVSATEWKNIDIGLPIDSLNLNEMNEDSEKRCVIKLRA